MGALIRAYDWRNSSLGPPEIWPQSLRLTIRLMLNTNHPMFIWWGHDLIQFYNDAYSLTMGPEMHPAALGAKGRESWNDIWPIIGPQIERVMSGQGATWNEDALVPIRRHGRREDVWWTYGYSPIDLEGEVGGVLVVCNDVTAQHRAREALSQYSRRLEKQFEQAPGFMAVLLGPDHVFELANHSYRKLVNQRDIIGKTVAEALPEVVDQGFIELLDQVYREGQTHVGRRVPIGLRGEDGRLRDAYLDFVYQPTFDDAGKVSGIFVQGSDITDHVRTETHLKLVNDELKHRVKNTLAMVGSIATQTLRGDDTAAAVKKFQQRLATFGKAHDILTAAAWATAEIDTVLDATLETHVGESKSISRTGPPLTLGAKQALSLSLALHEMATNAIKYGALSNETGRVSIEWSLSAGQGGRRFRFAWVETGGPLVKPPTRQGFGSRLIERVLSADFGGSVAIDYAPEGLRLELTAPESSLNNLMPSPFAEMEAERRS
ncbi:MAG: HWE histidine kinase domain-containing protein [Devosia sp.]